MPRTTHTYAILELSGPAFAEIRTKLAAAGYADAIHPDDDREVIDMHGLAVAMDQSPRPPVDIELASILSQATKEGKVELKVNGETVQMSLDKAREVHGMLGSAIEEALEEAQIDHLARQLEEHFEGEVAAGRAVRVERDGKTLYRIIEEPPLTETT